MGSNPLNLAFRFLLELAALMALGRWGWTQSSGLLRNILAVSIPLGVAIAWGTFAVPDDPSRSGRAPVPVPGVVRLVLELAIFSAASWALWQSETRTLGIVLGLCVIVHYALSYDRVLWLLRR
jgi:hypothetical protein